MESLIKNGKARRVLLALVVAAALVLRLAGLRSGLPSETRRLSTFHPDESVTFHALEGMDPAKLNFNPGMALSWGSFQVYLQGAVSGAMVKAGLLKIGGRESLSGNLKEADKLYVSGRLLVMLFGAASVPVLYRAAVYLVGAGPALFAAFLFGAAFLPVYISFFVRPDSFMLFWGLLSVLFAFRIAERPSAANYALSGLFAGLSAASKYPGGLFVFFLAWSHFYNAWRARSPLLNVRSLLLGAGTSIGVFALVNPYFVLSFSDAMFHISNWNTIHWGTAAERGAFAWRNYLDLLAYSLPLAMGWPLYLLSLAGLPLLVRDRSPYAAAVLSFMALYALLFGSMDYPHFAYFIQITVFLCVSAARAVSALSGRAAWLVLAALVTFYTAAYTVYLKSFFWEPGTPAAAGVWLEANVRPGASVAVPKKDIWTPPVIRQETPPYRVLEAAPSRATIADALSAFPAEARKADYLVVAEPEYGPVSGLPEERRLALLAEAAAGFREVVKFEEPMNRFFVPMVTDMHKYQLKLRAPDIRIFERARPPARRWSRS